MLRSADRKNVHKKQEDTKLYYEVFLDRIDTVFLDTPDRKSSELTSRVNSGHRERREWLLRLSGEQEIRWQVIRTAGYQDYSDS